MLMGAEPTPRCPSLATVFGALDDDCWAVLARRGLVASEEQVELAGLRKSGTAVCAKISSIVEHWRKAGQLSEWQANKLNEYIGRARGLAAKQIAFQLTGVPFPFFHLLTIAMIALVVSLQWNSAIRFQAYVLDGSCPPGLATCREDEKGTYPLAGSTELIGGIGITVAFKAIWHTALEITDPYGDDECDYDIDLELQNLWVEALECLNRLPGPRTEAMERFAAGEGEGEGTHGKPSASSPRDLQLHVDKISCRSTRAADLPKKRTMPIF